MLASLIVPAMMVQAVALAGPSTLSMSLSTTESVYGQSVTATATLATAPGPAQGDVVFSVDGLALRADLAASGTATAVLPAAPVGQHAVSAIFVPQLPDAQQASTSPAQAWAVAQARTRLQVRVTGKGARIPTSVRVKAAGEYGTRPTGRVRIVVRRTGTRAATRVASRLSATALMRAELGTLRKGRYRLVVNYAGDSQHLREVHVETFSVRRR